MTTPDGAARVHTQVVQQIRDEHLSIQGDRRMTSEERQRFREALTTPTADGHPANVIAMYADDLRALLDALDAAEKWHEAFNTACVIMGADAYGSPSEGLVSIRAVSDKERSRATAAEARVAVLEGLVAHLKKSLADQAAARHDPTMPLLTEEVLEALEGDAEAQYALADTREDRVNSHGLSLLCEWQRRALAERLEDAAGWQYPAGNQGTMSAAAAALRALLAEREGLRGALERIRDEYLLNHTSKWARKTAAKALSALAPKDPEQ